jgi:hypothetical protein
VNGPIGRAYGPQLSPLRRPCWRLLTLARLVVVAAAIGAALVPLVLTSARGWPCSPGRAGGWRLPGAGGPAAQVVGRHRRAAPAGITRGRHRRQLAGWTGGTPLWGGGGAAALRVGDPTRSRDPISDQNLRLLTATTSFTRLILSLRISCWVSLRFIKKRKTEQRLFALRCLSWRSQASSRTKRLNSFFGLP